MAVIKIRHNLNYTKGKPNLWLDLWFKLLRTSDLLLHFPPIQQIQSSISLDHLVNRVTVDCVNAKRRFSKGNFCSFILVDGESRSNSSSTSLLKFDQAIPYQFVFDS